MYTRPRNLYVYNKMKTVASNKKTNITKERKRLRERNESFFGARAWCAPPNAAEKTMDDYDLMGLNDRASPFSFTRLVCFLLLSRTNYYSAPAGRRDSIERERESCPQNYFGGRISFKTKTTTAVTVRENYQSKLLLTTCNQTDQFKRTHPTVMWVSV